MDLPRKMETDNLTEREIALRSLRKPIPSLSFADDASAAEIFQNQVLRPILACQHKTIHQIFVRSCPPSLTTSAGSNRNEILGQVKLLLSRHPSLKNTLLGVVLGLCTSDELATFYAMENELTKRIRSMLAVRITDALHDQAP